MRLPRCCQASLRVSACPVVAVEDAVELGMHPDANPIIEAALEPCDTPVVEGEALIWYEHPPKRYSDMAKVTVVTIIRLGLQEWPHITQALHAQRGELDYAVAALCIWLTTEVGQYVCGTIPLHRVPLHLWPDLVKPFANECRRLGQIFGRGPTELRLAFKMRRLVSLAGRTDAQADWAKEVVERTRPTTAKRGYYGGVVSSAAYRRIREKTLDDVAVRVVSAVKWKAGSFEEFFTQRWWHAPRGTTSEGAALKHKLAGQDPRLDMQLRPVKPVAMENWTEGRLREQLAEEPKAVARGSTKPEPGMKKRALLAVDDLTALIAGYASHHTEGSTKYEGMVLQQTPGDVAEWVAFDIGPHVWRVSNDYTNFNILHSLRSMQMVDLALAKQYATVKDQWGPDKVSACRWVAQSYNNAWIKTQEGEHKIRCGLWSGHRNTARDNTVLHLVYLRAVLSVQHALFGAAGRPCKQRICGDDETLAYHEWAPAACHTLIADALGFESQVSKGLLSTRHDEFLQLMRFPGSVPEYPVANTILTFCSGNWYKDPVRDLTTTIKDVSDHVWDMILGGIPQKVGRALATQVLNYLMQVKSGGELYSLEWQAFRGGNPGGHPLWNFVETDPAPILKADAGILRLPNDAAVHSMDREAEVWEKLGHHRQAEVLNTRTWLAYRVLAKDWLQHQYDP